MVDTAMWVRDVEVESHGASIVCKWHLLSMWAMYGGATMA